MKLSRRGFVGGSAGGVGLATLPTFLSSCFHTGEQKLLSDEIPSNPFQDWFGIDQQIIQKVLAELTQNGADFLISTSSINEQIQ